MDPAFFISGMHRGFLREYWRYAYEATVLQGLLKTRTVDNKRCVLGLVTYTISGGGGHWQNACQNPNEMYIEDFLMVSIEI